MVALIRPYLRYGTVQETAKCCTSSTTGTHTNRRNFGESSMDRMNRARDSASSAESAASTSCGVARARRTPPLSELRTVVLRTLPGALRTRVGPRSATQKLACLFVVLATSSAN